MSIFNDEPRFDAVDGIYRLKCEWRDVEGPGIAVVEAVAKVLRCDPLELEPLQNVVDVDSIESIITAPYTAPVSIEFEYADAQVTLKRSGEIVIDPL